MKKSRSPKKYFNHKSFFLKKMICSIVSRTHKYKFPGILNFVAELSSELKILAKTFFVARALLPLPYCLVVALVSDIIYELVHQVFTQ